jgi:hypothetical protein
VSEVVGVADPGALGEERQEAALAQDDAGRLERVRKYIRNSGETMPRTTAYSQR